VASVYGCTGAPCAHSQETNSRAGEVDGAACVSWYTSTLSANSQLTIGRSGRWEEDGASVYGYTSSLRANSKHPGNEWPDSTPRDVRAIFVLPFLQVLVAVCAFLSSLVVRPGSRHLNFCSYSSTISTCSSWISLWDMG
jgi:hypothetical protein